MLTGRRKKYRFLSYHPPLKTPLPYSSTEHPLHLISHVDQSSKPSLTELIPREAPAGSLTSTNPRLARAIPYPVCSSSLPLHTKGKKPCGIKLPPFGVRGINGPTAARSGKRNRCYSVPSQMLTCTPSTHPHMSPCFVIPQL